MTNSKCAISTIAIPQHGQQKCLQYIGRHFYIPAILIEANKLNVVRQTVVQQEFFDANVQTEPNTPSSKPRSCRTVPSGLVRSTKGNEVPMGILPSTRCSQLTSCVSTLASSTQRLCDQPVLGQDQRPDVFRSPPALLNFGEIVHADIKRIETRS